MPPAPPPLASALLSCAHEAPKPDKVSENKSDQVALHSYRSHQPANPPTHHRSKSTPHKATRARCRCTGPRSCASSRWASTSCLAPGTHM
jgi:hypothetical protein